MDQKYAPSILRVGISFIMLWFGINQLLNPDAWLGWLPSWTGILPIDPTLLLMLNAILEIGLGALLALGLFTRPAALLLLFHMIPIITSLGYNDVLIRDLGISIALISIFVHGPDDLSLDTRRNT